MLENTNQKQLNRIAEYARTVIGMIDKNGKIEYSDNFTLCQGLNSDFLQTMSKVREDITYPAFFVEQGLLFHNVNTEDNDSIFLFLALSDEIDEKTGRTLLGLAALALENQQQQNIKNTELLFRKLITEGANSVSTQQISQVYEARFDSYCVLTVAKSRNDSKYTADDNEIQSILRNVFPEEQGFIVVYTEDSCYAIICPVSDENTYEDILKYATTIHDVMLSEAMTDVQVSAGNCVEKLMSVNQSYREAKLANEIGLIFGVNSKCFVYSDLSLEKLIYSIPKEAAQEYINNLFGVNFLKDRSSKELLETVHAFLMSNLNVSEASRSLYIHRNTLMYRLDKFNKITGLDCTKFATGMQVYVALRILKYLDNRYNR